MWRPMPGISILTGANIATAIAALDLRDPIVAAGDAARLADDIRSLARAGAGFLDGSSMHAAAEAVSRLSAQALNLAIAQPTWPGELDDTTQARLRDQAAQEIGRQQQAAIALLQHP